VRSISFRLDSRESSPRGDESRRTSSTLEQSRRSSRCITRTNMVYDDFIVGPRCSAVVFNVLSRRFQLPAARPSPARGRVRDFIFQLYARARKRAAAAEPPSNRFIKVVWHIRSPRLLPRPRVGSPARGIYYFIYYFTLRLRRASPFSARRGIKADGHKVRKRGSFCITLASPRLAKAPARDDPCGTALLSLSLCLSLFLSGRPSIARALIKPTSTYRKRRLYKVSVAAARTLPVVNDAERERA